METSLEITIENFKKIDMNDACEKAGAVLKDAGGQKTITFNYLNRQYFIRLPNIEITSTEKEVETSEKITLLHYLISSKGTPPSGKLVDFRQVPDGNFYYSTFINLVHKPFLQKFGERPELFIEAGGALGGAKTDFKDFSMKFLVLPKVEVIVILYKGDEEFPPDCKFLFDSNILNYLSTEGIVKVCEELVRKLIDKGK